MALMTAKEAMNGGRMAAVATDVVQAGVGQIERLARENKLAFKPDFDGTATDYTVLLVTKPEKPGLPLCEIISRVCLDGSRTPHALVTRNSNISYEAWMQWWIEGGAALAAEKV